MTRGASYTWLCEAAGEANQINKVRQVNSLRVDGCALVEIAEGSLAHCGQRGNFKRSYSLRALFKIGMSGSASFQRAKKSS